MAIDWIYDTTYVSFGVEWNAAYKAVGKVTIQPVVYRWDRYNTADGSKFSETLRYEPNGSTGSWSNIGWGSGSGTRSIDPFSLRTYQRQASAYTVQLQIATDSGFGTAYDGDFHTIGDVTRTATYTVPALPPAFNTLSATRVSDNQVNLSWTAASGNIKAVCIERSVDGGSYSEVAVIWNASATSWQDNATTADHSYTYRARYHHEGAYGAYSNTVTVTMTPSAPQTISTAAIQGSTNVAVELGNASPVATSLEWQSSTDDGTTWSASTTVSGSPVTSFTATGISGTAYIRVRNVNSTGTSDWLVSEQVTTICPPAAPTLVSPTGVLDMAGGSVTFTWRHNPLDGSSQTAAQLAYSTNGGSTWTTVTKSTEESHTITPIPWAAGTTVTWRVRTKGADASYGDWAQAVQFDVYTAPTLNITSPSATITGMPIALTATYSDMAGFTCQAATVSLTKDGRTLYSEAATVNGTSITSSLDVSEFLPINGESYTVVLTARSSSSLQTTANATFTVDFVEPQAGELTISNDPDTGYASLLATFDNSASEITYTGSTNEQYESTEGYVRSLTVEGKSQKWNQLRISYNTPQTVATNVAIAESGGGITLSGTAAANAWLRLNNYDSNAHLVSGRVYALVMDASGGSSQIEPYIDTSQFGTRLDVNHIGTCTGTGILSIQTRLGSGTAYSGSIVYKIGIYDLTAMFGAGNEPATVDAFKATDVYKAKLAAGELYDYDAGSLVSIEGVGVWSQKLPEGYEPCGYVESLRYGNAIKTGVIPTANFGMDITFLTNDEIGGSSFGCICGGRTSSGVKDFQLTTFSATPSTLQGSLRCGSNTANPAITVGIKQRVFLKNGSLTRADGVTIAFSPNQAGEYEIYLFALNNGGSIAQCNIKPARIYRATFFDGNTTVADFVPCAHGDEVGFYDLIGNEFHGNFGSAHALVAGTDDWVPTTTIETPLRSAGSVHDTLMADADSWTVGRKVGVVDLGSLTWSYENNRARSYDLATLAKMPAQQSDMPNFTCSTKRPIPYSAGLANNHDGIAIDNAAKQLICYAANSSDLPTGTLFYELATPTVDTETSMSRIEIGSAFTVATDLDSTFSMTTWDGSADAVSISVSRVNADGTVTPLLTDGQSGAGIVDKYAPLNTDYQYAITTKAVSQAVKTVYVTNRIDSLYWFAYWGENVAKAKWNPDNGGIQVTRPQKTRVYYAGRRDPVSYDGHAVALTETPSWMFLGKDEVEQFVKLIEDGGRGVYKSCDGWVYHADFDLTMTPSYTAIGYYGGASLGIIRIAGEKL